MQNHLISVIVPVYNSEKYLELLIDSICEQTYRNIEIIFVDDGSQDQSRDIILLKCSLDQRIKYYFSENRGVSSARNIGIDLSKGEYIYFADSDDLLEKNSIEDLYRFCLTQNTELAVGNFTYLYNNGISRENISLYDEGIIRYVDSASMIEYFFKSGLGSTIWNKLYKKNLINNTRFIENIHYSEDFVFNYEIFLKKPIIGFLNKYTYKYRIHNNSVTYKPKIGLESKYLKIINHLKAISNLNEEAIFIFYSYYVYTIIISVGSNASREKQIKSIKAFLMSINNNQDLNEIIKILVKNMKKSDLDLALSHRIIIKLLWILIKTKMWNASAIYIYILGYIRNYRHIHYRNG